MTRQNREIVRLKRTIRRCLNQATSRGDIDGHDALGVLMVLSAEMVARVRDDGCRAEFVDTVVTKFPAAVDLERALQKGATLQ